MSGKRIGGIIVMVLGIVGIINYADTIHSEWWYTWSAPFTSHEAGIITMLVLSIIAAVIGLWMLLSNDDGTKVESGSTSSEWTCIKCGTKNQEDAAYCIQCGEVKPQPKIGWSSDWKCPSCDCMNISMARFCSQCGAEKPKTERIEEHKEELPKMSVTTPVIPEKTEDPDYIKCPSCGQVQKSLRETCHRCSTQFVQMEITAEKEEISGENATVEVTPTNGWICRSCGFSNAEDAVFCRECGTPKVFGQGAF